MKKPIAIPADLQERVREIPRATNTGDQAPEALAAAETEQARSTLIKTLSALSIEALAYVWRPIMYAYLWTDGHGHDRLTDDDMNRLHLSGMIAHGSPAAVEHLDKWRMAVERNMGKEAWA